MTWRNWGSSAMTVRRPARLMTSLGRQHERPALTSTEAGAHTGYVHLIASRAAAIRGRRRSGRRTFSAALPQVRKSHGLRYGAVTAENGVPGENSAGAGTGSASRRAARRSPAGSVGQPRSGTRPRAAKAGTPGSGQAGAIATEPDEP